MNIVIVIICIEIAIAIVYSIYLDKKEKKIMNELKKVRKSNLELIKKIKKDLGL